MFAAVGSAAAEPWKFHAHPEVWLLIAGIIAVGVYSVRVIGPKVVPLGAPVVTTKQRTAFVAGVVVLWAVSDWPLHDIAENYLYSAHMVQHTVDSVIAAPLLLMGTPTWLARWLLSPRWLLRAVRFLTRLIPATIVFNLVVIVTHTPVVVDASLRHAPIHFGVHALLLLSSLLVWMPLLSPLPEVPRLQPLVRTKTDGTPVSSPSPWIE